MYFLYGICIIYLAECLRDRMIWQHINWLLDKLASRHVNPYYPNDAMRKIKVVICETGSGLILLAD